MIICPTNLISSTPKKANNYSEQNDCKNPRSGYPEINAFVNQEAESRTGNAKNEAYNF